MSKSVAVIHTGPVTVEPIKQRCKKIIPEVRIINIMDDSLLNDCRAAGGLTKAVTQRMCQYFIIAETMGVDVIFNACSSVGETVDVGRQLVSIPIVKIDEAMAEQAVASGTKIGVVATVPTTLDPTVRLIEAKAKEQGKELAITRALCSKAFDLLLAGKADEHDQEVMDKVKELSATVDVVVLAQCSMARLVPMLSDVPVPVLASPDSGVQRLKEALDSL
jgi:Asp/Glu/hydantoin racemase